MIQPALAAPVASLIDDRLMPLGPGTPNCRVFESLRGLTAASLFTAPVTNPDLARACLAGLWLWHDFLDESHAISQDLHTPEGSWWHAIMHRREGDFWNSKYWLRRVGKHPAFAELGDHLKRERLGETWDPMAFVDRCERGEDVEICRKIQREEWRVLFDYCARNATA